jgi:homoserine dehydrogenase
MRVAILGFGNVGRALARLLAAEGDRPAGRAGTSFLVTGICTRTRGTLIRPEGVDLVRALDSIEREGLLPGAEALFPSTPARSTAERFILECPADIVVEATTLDARTAEPATTHIMAALSAGKHVVTANKGPVAWHFRQLEASARANGVRLLFESTVMDGAPVFNMARRCLRGCSILGFRGILNSTTNLVLDLMEEGATLEDGLAKAREMGIAEADPSLDVEGWDAVLKTTILATVLMDSHLSPAEVHREGMVGLDPARLDAARNAGRVLKLLCEADGTGARVRLAELPRTHPFSIVRGTSSALTIATDLMGEITIFEDDPGPIQTAYGILADMIEIAEGN